MRTAFLVLVLAAAACTGSSPSARGERVDPADAARLLIDRNWIDRMPETPRDQLHVYRFVPSMGGGVFQDRTLFKGMFELFTFEVAAGEIRIVTPEDGRVHRTSFHIDRIEDGPGATDLKLVLDDPPRGPTTYFGWSHETDRDGTRLDARLRAVK